MKKKYASILAAIICFLALGVAAKAQIRGEIVVTLPFEFVVSGKTLPAGTYTVSRFSDDKSSGLILSKIQTTNDVYNIPVSRSVIVEAAAGSRDNGSASGSSGSN